MAGMVLTNARVYTCASAQPFADTVVIVNGSIAHVGELESQRDVSGLPVHDLEGRTVIPGFIDSHTHPSMVTQSAWHVRLPWTTDVHEILAFIREYAEAHPPEEAPFLYFEYYPTATFLNTQPTKELLDSAVSDRPCLCQDFSEHSHWVNSKMLELMGITSETPDPVPGLEMFVRDHAGEPTGLLREMVHRHFLPKMYDAISWKPPEALTPERVAPFFRYLSEHGVTSLFEALVDDEEVVSSVAELDRRGDLNMYYSGAVRFRDFEDLPSAIERLKRLDAKHGNARISLNTVKLFLDGTNESGSSAVLAPMCHDSDPSHLGEIGLDTAQLADCLELSNAEGVDVHIHLVGDRAFRVACDAVEEVQSRVNEAETYWQIQVTLAHCELIDPTDMDRPARLGIIINWTPHWSGGYFGEAAKEHLGNERWNRMYRFNEVAQGGAHVTFGSDVVTAYELHRARPLFGMQIAHTRTDPEYPLNPRDYPESRRPDDSARIPRELLLEGYTINGARQLRLNDRLGSLEAGKVANMVVLAQDPFTVDASQLSGIPIDAVVFEGDIKQGSL